MIHNIHCKLNIVFKFVFSIQLFFVTSMVYAEGYVPLEALPGVTKTGTNLSEYLSAIFNIGVGVAGVLAVLMITVGGVQYIAGSANPSARSEAKKRITNAILGLILASSSWLLVYTINPNLVKNALNIKSISVGTSEVPISYIQQTETAAPSPVPTPLIVPEQTSLFQQNSVSSDGQTEPLYSVSSADAVNTQVQSDSPLFTQSYPVGTSVDNSTSYKYPPSGVMSSQGLYYSTQPPKKIDTKNDFNIIKECMSRDMSEVCSKADINKDGVVNNDDMFLQAGAFKYNVNGGKFIDYSKGSDVESCFLKEGSGNILQPDKACDSDMTCVSVPYVQSFPVKCVTDNNNDRVLTRKEFNKLKQVIRSSSNETGKVNLRMLYSNLFQDECADEFSMSSCKLFDRPLISNVIYSTLIQYDTNKDGIADFTGGDPLADFNGDGVVNKKDAAFVKFLNESIFKDGGLVPINFTLGGIEAWMFDGDGFTDRQIIKYCIGKTPIMNCAMADIDRSCSGVKKIDTCDVSQKDLDEFDKEVSRFDINGDGVVDFSDNIIIK